MKKNTVSALLLCGALLSVSLFTGCSSDTDNTPTTDTGAVTEEAGMKNGDTFVMAGHASEVLSTINASTLDYAITLFSSINDTYLADGNHNIVFSIIPDKNVYLHSEENPDNIPFGDYEMMVEKMKTGTADYATYLDLFPLLTLDDYYHADLHWKQETIWDVTSAVCSAFGLAYAQGSFDTNTFAHPFVGTYTKDLTDKGLLDSVGDDSLVYLTNDVLSAVTVADYPAGSPVEGVLYADSVADSEKSYDMFISGSSPLQILTSPHSATEKELIIFRDSFSSSLAPLLCETYRTITLVDLRYLGSAVLGNYIDFDDQDILFLYSTHLLNKAMIMK